MMEPGARGEILSIAFASKGQHQDAGAKVYHWHLIPLRRLPQKVSAKMEDAPAIADGSMSRKVRRDADHTSSVMALLLDQDSRSDTYPVIEISENDYPH